MTQTPNGTRWSGRTTWVHRSETPLRAFLGTETGSAAVLLGATVAALVWANIDASSYQSVWRTGLAVRFGHWELGQDLRGWINGGLMTFFFLVVGLEARREFDLGELRERRRVVVPMLAGLGGMVVPVAIFIAINAGHGSVRGWGTTMATDTAFALGVLALVGPRLTDRLRTFLLTVAVVDDLDSPREPVGRVHRDSTDAVVAEVLLHLRDQLSRPALLGDVDAERVVDLGELVREDRVEHDALDLDDLPRVVAVALVGHWISPR